MNKCAITIAGLVFAILALVHLGRIFCPFAVNIGGYSVPEWVSYVVFVASGLLSVYLFQARCCADSCTKE